MFKKVLGRFRRGSMRKAGNISLGAYALMYLAYHHIRYEGWGNKLDERKKAKARAEFDAWFEALQSGELEKKANDEKERWDRALYAMQYKLMHMFEKKPKGSKAVVGQGGI